MRPRDNEWESGRIGGGAPPIKTRHGWLEIYHGSGPGGYALFALLLDLADPGRVLKRGREPIFFPEAACEREGFFGRVVFCNGMIERDGRLHVYYGAADETCCLATARIDDILASL